VRDVRALGGEPARHARARLALALGRAGLAGDGPVARRDRPRLDLRCRPTVSSPSSTISRPLDETPP
jgi:hypothetical protein